MCGDWGQRPQGLCAKRSFAKKGIRNIVIPGQRPVNNVPAHQQSTGWAFLGLVSAGRPARRPICFAACSLRACIFLPASPDSRARLFEKRRPKNFYALRVVFSPPRRATWVQRHAGYTILNNGWLYSTTWPLPTQISAMVPSTSAGISFISFMASIMHRVSPFFTWSPTSTKGRASGEGEA